MRAAVFGILLAMLCGLACEPTHATDTTASVAPPTAVADPIAAAPTPTPASDKPAPTEAIAKGNPSTILPGRYLGPRVCLELFANGDMHLNDVASSPKVQVLGHTTLQHVDSADGGIVATLEVARIWKARYTSRCRKNHDLGDWTPSTTILGHEFAAGSHTLRLRAIEGNKIEVCAKTCEILERQASVLHGRWREPGLEGARETIDNPIDEVVDLDVDSHGGVWLSLGRKKRWASLRGPMTFEHLGDDRFTVTLTAEMVDTGAGVTAEPDSKWKVGATVVLQVERLPGERLEVCRTATDGGACTTLERMFDAYSHSVD